MDGVAARQPLLAVPNVTDHPSTASVRITVLLYNGPLLCGFDVPIAMHSISCFPLLMIAVNCQPSD